MVEPSVKTARGSGPLFNRRFPFGIMVKTVWHRTAGAFLTWQGQSGETNPAWGRRGRIDRAAFSRKARQIFGAVQMMMSRITWASAASSAVATAAGSVDPTGTVPENMRPA